MNILAKTKGVGLRSKLLSACFAPIMLMACSASDAPVEVASDDEASLFSASRIEADVRFLADDLLKGRDTGSEGYQIAANYVAAEFARLGLKPAGDDDSYFQSVPFKTATLNMDNSTMSLTLNGEERALALGDDFFMSGSVRNPNGDAAAEVVFAGYGVHDPELGHDDLAGLDLNGKIALVITGAPKNFNTEIRAHHGSSVTKAKALAARGAVGLISINSPTDEKRRPFARLKRFLGRPSFDWLMPEGSDGSNSSVKVGAAISHDVMRPVFEAAGKTLDDVLAAAENGTVGGFDLPASISMSRRSNLSDQFSSPNVLAMIEGSDPVLKYEYVALTAHLDHIGVNENAKGDDKINNGAMDNATGVSTLLEVARAYVRTGERPKRSLLFTIVTAEEKGLLGAEYFNHFPTVPAANIVANVNLDMPVLLYDFSDVVAFGAERSSLGPITEAALAKIGVTLSPDPIPEEGIFTRSDHYRFVQQGVPAVFLMTGFGQGIDGKDGGAIFREFLGKTYHSPRDDMFQAIDFDAGAKFAHANWLIASAIANSETKPSWNEGDFFGRTFGSKR